MCGIAGFIGQGDEKVLKTMTSSLDHRGPDGEGFFINSNVGLGHRRLSIIDLETGNQPIFNEDRSICTVYNGEIYNFQQLKNSLISKGHNFYTKSDTEVIVHLYEERGVNFLRELNGMFALAVWDAKKESLLLARDKMGEKPLYYSLTSGNLIFASEIKAILEHPSVKKELDFLSLAKYLNYEYVPSPQTIFKNIFKLGPGEYLTYQKGKVEKKKYWNLEFHSDSTKSQEDYLRGLDEHLNRSVKARLISDVPLGVWLSGGIDSTTVAYYAQKNSSEPIKTFSISFTDPSFDESKYARLAAKSLGTDHYEKTITPRDCLDLIPHIAEILDEPLADASIVPTFLLSRFTKQKVKVTLGGDGGDELFMGYPTFQAHQLAKFYGKIPSFLRNKLIAPAVNLLPASFNNISLDFKLKRLISGFDYRPEIRDQIWMGSFQPKDFQQLFSPAVFQEIIGENIFKSTETHLKDIGGESLENRLLYIYQKNYLQENCLVKTDRASMASGLEVRAPFLDHELVNFVNAMPAKLKLKGFQTKYILKKLMEDKIPREIVYRPKKGFGMPVAKWLKSELKDFTLSLFAREEINREGIFNHSYINQLLKEHFAGRKDHRKLLWTLMIFEIWQKKWNN